MAEHLDQRDGALDQCDVTHFFQLELPHAVQEFLKDVYSQDGRPLVGGDAGGDRMKVKSTSDVGMLVLL
eukprot:CAMPEP_0194534532 /NCGR_PEP_ID=MMETSP0253-20130528/72762_1 /TAXON_ID=2966 /ORGANISM="Noctiluca scintillans" /LENGTH=68 /DNA_ID=CAMNT_0039380203 /DNA_START=87 /DNA_END=294 /DNA_ORIENTATION=-